MTSLGEKYFAQKHKFGWLPRRNKQSPFARCFLSPVGGVCALQAAAPRVIATIWRLLPASCINITIQIMWSFCPVGRRYSGLSSYYWWSECPSYFTVAAEYALEDIRVKVFEKLHTLDVFLWSFSGSWWRVNNDGFISDFGRFFMELTFCGDEHDWCLSGCWRWVWKHAVDALWCRLLSFRWYYTSVFIESFPSHIIVIHILTALIAAGLRNW